MHFIGAKKANETNSTILRYLHCKHLFTKPFGGMMVAVETLDTLTLDLGPPAGFLGLYKSM